jgi:hypothetical protein
MVLLVVAIPLQFFGYATTCTQASDSSFTTGAFYSAIPLSLAIALVLLAAWRTPHRGEIGVLFILVTLGLLAITRGIWIDTIKVGTPCGPEFADYGWENPIGNAIILIGYVGLPVLMIVSASVFIYRARGGPK